MAALCLVFFKGAEVTEQDDAAQSKYCHCIVGSKQRGYCWLFYPYLGMIMVASHFSCIIPRL